MVSGKPYNVVVNYISSNKNAADLFIKTKPPKLYCLKLSEQRNEKRDVNKGCYNETMFVYIWPKVLFLVS